MTAKAYPRSIVAGISVIALAVSLFSSSYFETWDKISSDLMMRLRYLLKSDHNVLLSNDIALVGIDSKTQLDYGRWGSGQWISRKPFADLLAVMDTTYQPDVIAFDIIFQDALGLQSRRKASVTESPEMISNLVSQLSEVASNSAHTVSYSALDAINMFSLEQGNIRLTHKLASILERDKFSILCGYYFKMSGISAMGENSAVKAWSAEDVTGSADCADEGKGQRIPYILDMSVPAGDVAGYDSPSVLGSPASNAILPSIELVDFCLLGFLNGPPDPDGVVRRLPMIMPFSYRNPVTGEVKTRFAVSVSLAACLLRMGLEFPLKEGTVSVKWGECIEIRKDGKTLRSIPIDSSGCLYLDYAGKLEDFRPITFSGVIGRTMRAKQDGNAAVIDQLGRLINNKICYVGITSTGIDIGASPLEPTVPLIIAHLTATENIMKGRFIRPLKGVERGLLFALLFLLFTGICLAENTLRFAPTAFCFFCFYILLAYFMVHFNKFVFPLAGPAVYMGLCSFSVMSFRLFTESRARRRIKNMFSTMVSDKVLAFLEQNPDSFSLNGYSTEATVFFSDIQGFTTLGEHMPPDKLTNLLNDYLDPVSDCIFEYGGYLDKYMGDGIMAVWGAPFYDSEHAYKACASALRQLEIIRGINDGLMQKYGVSLNVRMGINSGKVIAGNMGSSRRFQYTVIGDEVNLAARLEPANKEYGSNILISEATYLQVKERFLARKLGRISVVGKAELISIYELLCENQKATEEVKSVVSAYEEALRLFVSRDWDGAVSILSGFPGDKPSQALLRRAVNCRLNPPPPEWSGELIRSHK